MLLVEFSGLLFSLLDLSAICHSGVHPQNMNPTSKPVSGTDSVSSTRKLLKILMSLKIQMCSKTSILITTKHSPFEYWYLTIHRALLAPFLPHCRDSCHCKSVRTSANGPSAAPWTSVGCWGHRGELTSFFHAGKEGFPRGPTIGFSSISGVP